MVITPCDQSGAGWRTKRGGMEGVVAESLVGEALKVRRLNRAAERAARPEADIIGQDQKDVRSALWCLHTLWKIRGRILRRAPNLALEWLLRLRQHLLSKSGGGQRQQ